MACYIITTYQSVRSFINSVIQLTTRASPSRPGNLRHLIAVIQQLDFNYDLYGMRAEEILQLLPAEFDAWRPAPSLWGG